jgi:hypothetical protein
MVELTLNNTGLIYCTTKYKDILQLRVQTLFILRLFPDYRLIQGFLLLSLLLSFCLFVLVFNNMYKNLELFKCQGST